MPFTTLPTVLTPIAQGLHTDVSSLGLLTSLPLLMFALISSFASKLGEKFGLERLFFLVLLVMTVGSAIRVFNLPSLYLGTLLLGGAIAILNVLLPSLIQANKPHRIGTLTTLYVTSMGIATAVSSSLAVPITQGLSWKGLIWILTGICLLALLVWLPNLPYNHRLVHRTATSTTGSFWTNSKVWAIIIFGGLQSLLFYTCLTWLPTMATQAGLSDQESGLLASIFSLISIPFSLFIPNLTTSLAKKYRRLMLSFVSLSGLVGLSMLLFAKDNFHYWLILNLLIGIAVSALFPYLMVTFSMKASSPDKTAQLSGIAQTGGYILAAIGPLLFGYSADLLGSWTPAILVLLLLTVIMTIALFIVDNSDQIL
ncbi:hypothetical protein STRDD10_01016 [Streptococcus sp. DD10]|nr:hypothetical protein STRDD10_01016 [Streptococcus sp. DD10]